MVAGCSAPRIDEMLPRVPPLAAPKPSRSPPGGNTLGTRSHRPPPLPFSPRPPHAARAHLARRGARGQAGVHVVARHHGQVEPPRDLVRRHGAGQVLLVGQHQEGRALELLLVDQALQLVLGLRGKREGGG